ncbi:MAG: MBL fold metallo-hydrolase [Clostridiales bacterium]|nr:MBL fold metallo-hydrolase [Clostridiales bacterium]MDY6117130.1 MBL fold metallo-hydrolase [Anaerovoracaceae bacterium]
MKIKFCGAAEGVTGSCHLLTTDKHKILLDCGQYQGGKAQDEMNFMPFPFSVNDIEAVVLSHAHIDHCGRLPLLVKRGYDGPIYATKATADLLQVMLRDSAYIHEKEAEWKNKKADRLGRKHVDPLYTIEDAEAALKLVVPVLYNQLIELNDEMRVVFNDAGHILGSGIIEIWAKEGDGENKIVFSGDLGMTDRPIIEDPTIIKKADYVIMESTYGSRNHPENSDSISKLLDIVEETTKRGGSVIIPSFAVGRTQELIYEFNKFFQEGGRAKKILEDVLVYVDSPMANMATEVFRNNAQVFDDETKDFILKGDNPLDFPNLRFTRSTQDSMALNGNKTPKVIISASGMCEAGRIRHHLKHGLWDSRNSIVFVGYQAEGTLGRRIVEGAEEVSIMGETIKVQAQVHNLEGFSGHADQNGLLDWISGFQVAPKQVFLVHGEEESKRVLGKLIEDKLGYKVQVIEGISEFELEKDEVHQLSHEDSIPLADKEEVKDLRKQLEEISSDLQIILKNVDDTMSSDISAKKANDINNYAQELKNVALNLGASVALVDRRSDEELFSGPQH